MTVEDRLAAMGLSLPQVPEPVANYIHAVQVGSLLLLSGTIGFWNGTVPYVGKVGAELTVEQAYESARLCALNHLAVIKQELGSLDRVARVVRLVGYVNSAPGFREQPRVVNGASDLLVALYGERGRHARAALGVSELAYNAPVETILTVQVSE